MSPLRRLAAIVGWTSRVQAVGDRIVRLGPDAFVDAIDELARDAAKGATVADVDAMLACALFFLRGREDTIPPLAEAARKTERMVALALLDDAEPHKALSRLGRPRDQGGPRRVIRDVLVRNESSEEARESLRKLYSEEPWKSLLKGSVEDRLPQGDWDASWERVRLPPAHVAMQVRRLASSGDTGIVRTLLDERLTRPKDVLRIASKRPLSPDAVDALVERDGWILRPEVRAALVENPFTPTRVSLLFLPTCRASFRSIAKADLHPRLKELVKTLSAAA